MPAEAITAVTDDLNAAFPGITIGGVFDSVARPTSLLPDVSSEDVWAVSWSGSFTFDRPVPALLGIEPTGQRLTLRGVTLVTAAKQRSGDPVPLTRATPRQLLFHRFIDWIYVFSQLGVAVVPRPLRQPTSPVAVAAE
jgi:hypothetical protein